ncbi:type II secretion system F family protein [Longimicrobium terrae]|uniref:Type IV pilus assembly protein PilC n=1 Tax=Longimicrobium terrae TaxID=1639882 RepID=A0A841H1R1_9BACT|nr:type II secretion system F family protein [Longimicrobium terrae]MBB4637478.1 type IV pilus assembly protein PilC [Longimicrobium terrae]MBB6071876.1 type IV pilus assembly protein PilC [Longimicrobium terrae]NNC30424.1 type II secretion system F family protein [Longimicrobium terrae]
MPVFAYSARAASGELTTGEIDLPSRDEVVGYLVRQRLRPVAVNAKAKEINIQIGTGVKTREVVIFTRQFATMINSGLPLVQSLTILSEQTENKVFSKIIAAVLNDIQSGMTLADAMRKHPKIFTELYTNMVAAGEAGGILDTILLRLAVFLEKNDALVRKIKGAMTYPLVMLSVVVLATTILLWKVVPVFATIFMEAGLELPAPTRVVLAASKFLQSYIFYIIVMMAVGAWGLAQYYKTERGQLVIDRTLLRLPILGDMMRKSAVSRFTRTLGTLISSGVSILEGLQITAKTSGNRVIHDAVMASRASIAGGATISEPLKASGVFPPMVVQMINVGEQTGGLDDMLSKIADFYDDEVDAAVSALTSVLEPIMIVVMGVVIGGMVVAMYMPMFDMIQTAQ